MALYPHWAPRAYGGRTGRKAGCATEQHGSEPSKVPVADDARAPPSTRLARLAQLWPERPTPNGKMVGLPQQRTHVDHMRLEHRIALEDAHAVQVDVRSRRDPLEVQEHSFVRLRGCHLELRAEPPILAVEVSPWELRIAQRAGRGAGNTGGKPLKSGEPVGLEVLIRFRRPRLPSAVQFNGSVALDQSAGPGRR